MTSDGAPSDDLGTFDVRTSTVEGHVTVYGLTSSAFHWPRDYARGVAERLLAHVEDDDEAARR